MEFKEFLLKGIKVIRTSLGIPVPVEDLLGGFLSLVEKLDQLGENEVLRVALYWALYKSLEDALKELGKEFEQQKYFQEAVKNLFRELDKKLTALSENGEIFDLSRFSLNNFYETEAVKEILRILNEVVDRNLKPIEGFPADDLKRLVRNRLKLFFWIVVEEDENRFKKLLDNLKRESSGEKLKEYYIDRYLSKEVKEFTSDPIFGKENEIPLEQVYVEPHYAEYQGSKDEGIFEIIKIEDKDKFKRVEKSIFEELYPNLKEGRDKLILILGHPGEGKTSLARKIVYDYKTHRLDIEKDIYLLKLRDVRKRKIDDLLTGDPEIIKEELENLIFGEENLKLDNFKKSVVILDGLDELLMTENYLSDKGEQFIKQLLKVLNTQSQWKDLQIVITSRLGYVEPKKLYKLKGLKILKLEGFNLEQQKEWIREYSQYHPDKVHYLEQIERVPEETRKLLSQPILLYIAVSSGVDLSAIKSKIDIYEALIDAVIKKKWDKIEGHPNLGALGKEKFKELLGFLAFLIFKHQKEYIHSSQLKGEKEFIDLLKETFKEYISENCLIKLEENYGGNIPAECLENLLKGLLILFYLRKREEKDRNFALEFYHKSIQEFLTAEYFYIRLLNLSEDIEKAENLIWDLFSHRQITLEIRVFLEQIIENRREKDRERQNQFMERVKKLLPPLLEKNFLLKPSDGENTFNKALWCFGNFWIFTNEVAPIKDWDDETKQKFACMVKYTQTCEETFVVIFPLIGVDLKGVNLRGANLSRAYLSRADLSGADLSRADLRGARLRGANLSRADLSDAYLSDANLSRANLNNAYLSGADLSRANLRGARLRGANLSRADLSDAYLSGADLRGANLSRANLNNAYLSGADLRGADLSRANLNNAYLIHADLFKADLRGAIFDPEEIKKAKNWDKAIYDDEMKRKLGLE